jgi:hypothetical protein
MNPAGAPTERVCVRTLARSPSLPSVAMRVGLRCNRPCPLLTCPIGAGPSRSQRRFPAWGRPFGMKVVRLSKQGFGCARVTSVNDVRRGSSSAVAGGDGWVPENPPAPPAFGLYTSRARRTDDTPAYRLKDNRLARLGLWHEKRAEAPSLGTPALGDSRTLPLSRFRYRHSQIV